MCKIELKRMQERVLSISCTHANHLLEAYHNYICNRPTDIPDAEFNKISKQLFKQHSDYMEFYRAIESETRAMGI